MREGKSARASERESVCVFVKERERERERERDDSYLQAGFIPPG